MKDPYEFLTKLERQLKLFSVPANKYGSVLVSCVQDRLMCDHIEKNILPVCSTWEAVKLEFRRTYDDPQLKNEYILQLENCTQSMTERVYQYTERYQSLAMRTSGGSSIDTSHNIVMCERGFIPEIRKELAQYRAAETRKLGSNFEFKTLAELYKVAATIESGLAPRPGRVGRTRVEGTALRNRRRRPAHARVANLQEKEQEPHLSKIELTTDGKPVNVNKKHKKRVHTQVSSSLSTSSSRGRGGWVRGGGFVRDGGTYYGGNRVSSPSSSSSTGNSRYPDRFTTPRGTGTSSSAPTVTKTPFKGTCYICNKEVHKAVDCSTRKQL